MLHRPPNTQRHLVLAAYRPQSSFKPQFNGGAVVVDGLIVSKVQKTMRASLAPKRKIERKSLPDVIADDLRERILNGDMAEGEVIRQENLAEDYGVSRMPVREALKRLDAEGLVVLTNNRGATVTKHSLEEIGEIFDLRTLIETDLFRRAIPLMATSDFKRCADILTEMENSLDEDVIDRWGALNFQFHSALYAKADRRLTNELLQRIGTQSDRYVRMHLSLAGQKEAAKQEHRDLLRLAEARDVDQACALLAQHIDVTKHNLLKLIADKRAAEDT
jgi:DNA-binding GntR family transcriptional regulator